MRTNNLRWQCKPSVIGKASTAGITLVALVVTIVVLLILAGITINYVFSDNGIFAKASEAQFKTRWTAYKEQADTYATWKMASTMSSNVDDINAGDTLLELIDIEADGVDIQPEDVNIPISDIVNNLDSKDKKYAVVYHGELCYVKDDRNKNGEKEANWCEQVGIPVLELKKPSSINNQKGDYEYVNGVYLCTPVLKDSFNKNYTRYVNEVNGVMQPKNWIFDKATEDWYDYSKGKWANIVTENLGIECYYTWIPRYCFKLNKGSQRTDVKLIDINNNYKDPYTDEETSWETLKSQGYQVPEAFTFNGKALPGYWAMKYNVGDAPTTSTLYYDMKVTMGAITISNIKLTNVTGATKIVVNLNSKEQTEKTITNVAGITASTTIRLENMKSGENVINLTALNAKGEMVASYTRVYGASSSNPPDLTGFDKDSTFYVMYDENDNEYSTTPISEEVPFGWYNYEANQWANIVVRNEGTETYYTWIPRYEFFVVKGNERTEVRFVSGNKGATDTNRSGVTSGYQIPEAFKFNGKEITGYWAMKYNVGDKDTSTLNAEVVTTSSSITIKGLKGTTTSTSGLTYNYYISGKPRGKTPDKTTRNAADQITFEGLTSGKEYFILIEVRNGSKYVGSLTKRVRTAEANKPDLTGFKPANTKYVLYNGSTETIGTNITNDGSNMPANWYNYSQGRWANIVVENNSLKTYYTWIPRYEFKPDGNAKVQRNDVRFLTGTSAAVTPTYQVPEAFKFNNKALTGFWAMKYNVGG